MWGTQNTNKIPIIISDCSDHNFTIAIDLNSDTMGSLKDKYIDKIDKFCSHLTLIEYKQTKYWYNKHTISIDDSGNVIKFEDRLYFKTHLNKENIKNNIEFFIIPFKKMNNDNILLRDYGLRKWSHIYPLVPSEKVLHNIKDYLLYYRVDDVMNKNEKNNIIQHKQITDAKKNRESLMHSQLFKNFDILNNKHFLQKNDRSDKTNDPNNGISIIDITVK